MEKGKKHQTVAAECAKNSNFITPSVKGGREVCSFPPAWLRIPEAVRLSGLCRSTLYTLIGARKLKSFSSKINPECQRGTRLISYASLLDYLESAFQQSVAEEGVAQ
jgi:hypothetical protein